MAGSLALAACGISAGTALPSPSTTPPSVAPSVAESPPPSTSPSPSASTAAERTNVSGRMGGEGLYKEDEATSRLYFEFTYTMSDPRVSGTEKIDCTERFFDLPDLGTGAGVGVWWDCSSVLTGQGGTWKGVTGYGSEYMKDGQLRTNGTNIYEGQGAFAGLRYVTLFSSGPEMDVWYPEGGYQIAGWIEPAE
jgi:hypothetical protein